MRKKQTIFCIWRERCRRGLEWHQAIVQDRFLGRLQKRYKVAGEEEEESNTLMEELTYLQVTFGDYERGFAGSK